MMNKQANQEAAAVAAAIVLQTFWRGYLARSALALLQAEAFRKAEVELRARVEVRASLPCSLAKLRKYAASTWIRFF